jgi:hypothetical protein
VIIKSNEVTKIMKMLFENNVGCIILPFHMPGNVYKHLTFVAELYFEHILEFV